MRERRRGEPAVDLVERTPRPDGRERGRERTLPRGRVMHVVRCDDIDTRPHRDLGQRVVAVTVERVAVIPELDQHPVTTEPVDKAIERAARPGRSVIVKRARNWPLAATREDEPAVVVRAGPVAGEMHAGAGVVEQRRELEAGRALLAGELTAADGAGEAGVADRPLGEHDEVLAGWVGDAVSTGSLTAGRDTRPAAVRSRGELPPLTPLALVAALIWHPPELWLPGT